ncbi:MAG: hypothetical protein DRP64_12460 [Verrucomicrobia bacterium]|nr:MAG: hypothetical protein DRP64_12460 [Verrucomicrobiota bacterium]
MKKLTAITIIALIACAHHSWSYETPIENQAFEIIDYPHWILGTTNLTVGGTTGGNAMFIVRNGFVQNARGYVGVDSGSTDNKVYVMGMGAVWSNSLFLTVGEYGSNNYLSITQGGRVQNTWGSIGYQSSASSNTVSIYDEGSSWINSSVLRVGAYGSGNRLGIWSDGRVQNTEAYIGEHSGADNNGVMVDGQDAEWNNTGILYVGGNSGGAGGGTGNWVSVQDDGTISAETLVVYPGNNFNLAENLLVSSDFDASQSGFNWYNGGHLSVGGDLSGMWPSSTLDGTDKRLTINGGAWINSTSLEVGAWESGNALSITNGGRVENTSSFLGYNSSSSNNTVTVSGSGSVWINSGFIMVGFHGSSNALSITDGGRIENTYGDIGSWDEASNNTASVSGTGSVWSNSSSLYVGSGGSGNALSITDFGKVQNDYGYIGGSGSASNNTVTVTGDGSVWINSGSLRVGAYGSGNKLQIINGGRTQNTSGSIGTYDGADNNMVEVYGSNSLWESSGTLYVGTGGTNNSLEVFNGGRVVASSGTVYPTNRIWLYNGTLDLTNAFTLKADAKLFMSGFFDEAGAHCGHLWVGGLATLNGILKVGFDNFDPAPHMVLDLFDWDGDVSGGFAELDLIELPFGLGWNTNKLYTTGELSISYATADTDDDGMPDGWELEFCGGDVLPGGNLDFDPHGNRDEYIAGTDPDNSDSFFRITNATDTVSGFLVEWDPCVSGRVYGINWTNDLANGFTSIVENIDFPQNSYTDATYNADDAGFYKIEVQLK